MRGHEDEIHDLTDLETIPSIADVLYLSNTWHQRVHIDEVHKDLSDLSPSEKLAVLAATRHPSIPLPKMSKMPRKKPAARREASAEEKRMYAKQFHQAKLDEYVSWSQENDIYDLVDLRKQKVQSYITGR